MISNLHIGVDGRLGNQLFQYAALKSLALHNGYECVLPPLNPRVWHGQPCMLSEFNLQCGFSEKLAITKQYEEPSIVDFDENFFNIEDGTAIRGFFQNTKYFENFEEHICKELRTNEVLQERANQILSYYKNQFPDASFKLVLMGTGFDEAPMLDPYFFILHAPHPVNKQLNSSHLISHEYYEVL